jgi:hypothetical protein
VAEREFIGQYGAQDDQDALYSADFGADPSLSYNYMTEAQQAEQDALYSADFSTDPNISYVHKAQDASDMTSTLSLPWPRPRNLFTTLTMDL